MLAKTDTTELDQWAQQLSQDFLPKGWERVTSSAFTHVAHHAERALYYKEFLPRSPMERTKAMLRGSRATRARRNSEALLRAGFDAPENIHWGTLPGGKEYLYCATAPGLGIAQWLRQHGQQTGRKRQLLEQLGVYIGRLHQTGFIHGDLRPDNILAHWQGERFRFTLLDNERNQRRRPPPGKAILRNLMQLNMLGPQELTRSDRMRFYRAWKRQLPQLPPEESWLLAREANRWARKRIDKRSR